jgi:hypothetical protein
MFGRLEKAYSVTFGIDKACIQTNARNIHGFPEHLPSPFSRSQVYAANPPKAS